MTVYLAKAGEFLAPIALPVLRPLNRFIHKHPLITFIVVAILSTITVSKTSSYLAKRRYGQLLEAERIREETPVTAAEKQALVNYAAKLKGYEGKSLSIDNCDTILYKDPFNKITYQIIRLNPPLKSKTGGLCCYPCAIRTGGGKIRICCLTDHIEYREYQKPEMKVPLTERYALEQEIKPKECNSYIIWDLPNSQDLKLYEQR